MNLKILSIAIECLLLMLLICGNYCQKQANDQNKERDFFIKFHINYSKSFDQSYAFFDHTNINRSASLVFAINIEIVAFALY